MPPQRNSPRIRQLLRQAEKVADAGKNFAAQQIYEEIIAEAPETAEAWLGLSQILPTAAERESAKQRALTINPHIESAPAPKAVAPPPTPPQPAPAPDPLPEPSSPTIPAHPPRRTPASSSTLETKPPLTRPPHAPAVTTTITCYRHPSTETSLRCNRCERPICIKCANRTSVGYRCPDCIHELEEKYYTGTQLDYLIATAVSGFLSFLIGIAMTYVSAISGFFFIFIIFLIGGGTGTLLARLTHMAIGRRRNRYMAPLVTAVISTGLLLPSLLLFLLTFRFGIIIYPAIFTFVAASAAYYFLK